MEMEEKQKGRGVDGKLGGGEGGEQEERRERKLQSVYKINFLSYLNKIKIFYLKKFQLFLLLK